MGEGMGNVDEAGQWVDIGEEGSATRGGRGSGDEGRIGKGETKGVGVVEVA